MGNYTRSGLCMSADERRARWQSVTRQLTDSEAGRRVMPYFEKLVKFGVLSDPDEAAIIANIMQGAVTDLSELEEMATSGHAEVEAIRNTDRALFLHGMQSAANCLIIRQGLLEIFTGSMYGALLTMEARDALEAFRGTCAGDEERAKLQPLIDYMEQTEIGQAVKLELSRNQEPERRPNCRALLPFVCGPDKELNCVIATECISYHGGKKLALIVKSLQRNNVLSTVMPPTFPALKEAGAIRSQQIFNRYFNDIKQNDLGIDREVRDVIRKHTTKL